MKTLREVRKIAREGGRRLQHEIDTARLDRAIEKMVRVTQEQRKKNETTSMG